MNIEHIFSKAVTKKASDVHLVAGMPPIIRVDGELDKLENKALSSKDLENLIYEFLSNEQKDRFLNERGMDLSYQIKNGTRFRVNIFFERNNMSLVARVINETIPSFEELIIPPLIETLLTRKQGLILVTGPTGCGKSTTLAAMIERINQTQRRNIVTLEDPIEFLFKPHTSIIVQRQLGTDMTSFKSALRHVMRQDPNVIMVGEMRDLETIAATITLAETGHLVLATLHTYSAAQTIDRIIDIFPPYQQNQINKQLSSVLAAVISQRLLPAKEGGRIAAREILLNTPATANLIRENKMAQINHIIETSAKEGMITMEKAVKNLYKEGKITKETAESYVTDLTV